MKKGLKKILAATTALALLLSMGMTAMAAEYTTVTRYDADGVHVETTVSTATTEKEYTYLVHKSADPAIADSEIVYIDQKKASGGTVLFSFDTDVDNLGQSGNVYSATIQVGSNDGSAWTPEAAKDGVINLVNKTVTYSAENGYVYVDEDAAEALNAGSTSTFDDEVIFHLVPAAGYKIDGMTITKNEADLGASVFGDTYTAPVANGDVFKFIFAEIEETGSATVSTVNSELPNAKEEGGITFTPNQFTEDTTAKQRQITVFGTVIGVAEEFGVIVSRKAFTLNDDATNIVAKDQGDPLESGDAVFYKALGAGTDGNYAISLYEKAADGKAAEEYETLLKEPKLYVAVYSKGTDGKLAIADVDAEGMSISNN